PSDRKSRVPAAGMFRVVLMMWIKPPSNQYVTHGLKPVRSMLARHGAWRPRASARGDLPGVTHGLKPVRSVLARHDAWRPRASARGDLRPLGVEAAVAIDAAIRVRPEVVALALRQVGRQPLAAVRVVPGKRRAGRRRRDTEPD